MLNNLHRRVMKSVPPRGSGWVLETLEADVGLPDAVLDGLAMKSVPPRGSGWVLETLEAGVGLPGAVLDGLTSMRSRPTRYREVVLTSCEWLARIN